MSLRRVSAGVRSAERTHRRGRTVRVLTALAVGGAAAVAVAALILTRPFADAPWDEAPPNPASIYEPGASGASTSTVVSPFHLETDPMAGLLLANFEEDPDRVYLGLEPQAFDDPVHGRGLLVIGWRVDGRVDVFHDPELRLDPETYRITGDGLHRMAERSFANALFELGPEGARVDLGFEDLEGREVRLVIRETDARPRRPFGLLAPMGHAVSDPPALPLVFLHDFYFVRRAGTEARIEIDGRLHRGDGLPLPIDRTRVHFHRYSPDPFIVTWNPEADAADILQVDADAGPDISVEERGVRYELTSNGDQREIRRMSRSEGAHEVVVAFSPAFPDLRALRDGIEVSGAFRISADPSVGTVTGRWTVERRDRQIHMEAVPEGGWTPGEVPPMARLMFRMVPMFRSWPGTYRWRGTLELPPPGPIEGLLPFRAGWERLE